MLKKVKLILVLISLSIATCLMSNTYSRYVADTTGNIDALFSKWQIMVNSTDITNGNVSTIQFTPTIVANPNVAANTVAPSSTGYFDIVIDPSNVDLSFDYDITLSITNNNMPDLLLTKYAVLPTDNSAITYTDLTDNLISSSMLYDNETENFSFKSFTIRVCFEWREGKDETMNDAADTLVGTTAATEDTSFTINANISFKQII